MSLLLANRALIKPSAGGSPPILEDGNTVAWYIADDLSTITKDGSDFMSEWRDKLGSGHDLLQATGADQPLWSSTGILFDGIRQFMKTLAFTYNQPEQIYIVFKQVSWANQKYVFDGDIFDRGGLIQLTGSPTLRINSGAYSPDNSNLAINTYGIVRVLFDGVNSKLIINNTTPTTGDTGINNMGGFTLGAYGLSTFHFSNIQVKEIILRNIADTPTDEQDIYDYLKDRNSL